MTIANMEPGHKFLAMKSAMTQAYKQKNFIHAASFAKLILDLDEQSNIFSGKPEMQN